MEYLAEIIQLFGERLIDFQTRAPTSPQTEELNRKGFYILRVIFMGGILLTASVLPAFFAFSSFLDGIISDFYLIVAIFLIILTIITSLLIFPKILLLLRQYSENQSAYEATGVEDEVKYQLGIELLLLLLTFIPVAHILFCPLTVDRATNIIEITSSSRQKVRRLAANLAGYAIVVFLLNSLLVSIMIMVLGDTRV